MKKLRQLLRLFRTFLITSIAYIDKKSIMIGKGGGQTSLPSPYVSEITRNVFSDLINLFFIYTGELGSYISVEKKVDKSFFKKRLLEFYSQSYLFHSIEEVREHSVGVLLLATNKKFFNLTSIKKDPEIELLGIYIDSKSTSPDIIIQTRVVQGDTAVSICYKTSVKAFVEVNILPMILPVAVKKEEILISEKIVETIT